MSKLIATQTSYLRSSISANDTTIPLKFLKDKDGNNITSMPAGATILSGTIEPNSERNIEFINFTGIQDDGNGKVTLTGVTRHINPQPPYDALTPSISHGNGMEFILSNSPDVYSRFATKTEEENILEKWTFAISKRPVLSGDGDTTDPKALITYGQLLRSVVGGIYVNGSSVKAEAGEDILIDNVIYLNTDGKWYKAKADTLTKVDNVILGIAKNSTALGDDISGGSFLSGFYTLNTSTLSVGLVYVDNNGIISNTAGTYNTPIGVAVSSNEIIFDPNILKRLTSDEKSGISNAYGGKLSQTNPVLSKNSLYTDGISISQTTQNASIGFGQTDNTTKNFLLEQQFSITKNTIKSLLFKKGATISTNIIDNDGSTFSYSESDGNNNFSDGGVISGYRQVNASGALVSAGYFGGISKTYNNLIIGQSYTFNADIEFFNNGYTSSIKYNLLLDSTSKDSSQSSFSTTTKSFTFTATATSHTVNVRMETMNGTNVGSGLYLRVKNTSLVVPSAITSDITLNIYNDNSDNPDTTSLTSKTITASNYNAIAVDGDVEFLLSSVLTGLDITKKYWVVLSQATPSDTNYPQLKYQNTNQTGFTIKRWNTPDGYVSVTGALYLIIKESGSSKIVSLDSSSKINNDFILLSNIYFGSGSDGDVVISSNTTLTRDMYYNNLTVNSGVSLITGNYTIYVKGTLTNNGTIKANPLGALGSAGTTNDTLTQAGGTGGLGGNGGVGGRISGSGGTAINITDLIFFKDEFCINQKSLGGKDLINIAITNFKLGGGGGSGASAQSGYGTGGTGGRGGGSVVIIAYAIAGNGVISADGANGGDYGVSPQGGGGGGGGGGHVLVFHRSTTASYTITVNGGLGGINTGGGRANSGSNGVSFLIQI